MEGLDTSQHGNGTNTFKVVIVGDKSIGKTCIIKRFQDNTFTEREEMTLGAQFYAKKMKAEYMV
jgi:GTPase SAR1 family protein